MDDHEFLTLLRQTTETELREYRSTYPAAPPLLHQYHITGEEGLSELKPEHLRERFSLFSEYFDELFGVDTSSRREEWWGDVLYDTSDKRLESLPNKWHKIWIKKSKELLFNHERIGEAAYHPQTNTIGVSYDRATDIEATDTLSSELVHCYQHELDSPTWNHVYLREGFEKAASIKGIEYVGNHLGNNSLIHLAARKRVETLLKGYYLYATSFDDPPDIEFLQGWGLSEQAIEELQPRIITRVIQMRNHHRGWFWSSIQPEYVTFASLLSASEAIIENTFERAFRGTHPWEFRIDRLSSLKDIGGIGTEI